MTKKKPTDLDRYTKIAEQVSKDKGRDVVVEEYEYNGELVYGLRYALNIHDKIKISDAINGRRASTVINGMLKDLYLPESDGKVLSVDDIRVKIIFELIKSANCLTAPKLTAEQDAEMKAVAAKLAEECKTEVYPFALQKGDRIAIGYAKKPILVTRLNIVDRFVAGVGAGTIIYENLEFILHEASDGIIIEDTDFTVGAINAISTIEQINIFSVKKN
jgi:hypothetical protein